MKEFGKKINTFIKEKERIGIIFIDEESKLQLESYRPKKIKEKYKNESLLGFFIKLPYNEVTLDLENVFIFNFLHKLSNPESEPYLYVRINDKNELISKFFYLECFEEIYYDKFEANLKLL